MTTVEGINKLCFILNLLDYKLLINNFNLNSVSASSPS